MGKTIIINENTFKTIMKEELQNNINANINILVACEESQAISTEFRKLGFNAYSCDLKPCSGGHPEYHIMGDCLPLLHGDNYTFKTEDGQTHNVDHWNLIMAHPVCTYLTTSGNRWFNVEKYGDKALERIKNREEGAEFFMKFTNADADHIAIENPIGVMSSRYRKPNQIVQPWMWGDKDVKSTCLWTNNLPNLVPDVTEKPDDIEYKEWVDANGKKKRQSMNSYNAISQKTDDRQCIRSKTYPGIAKAIANQWGKVLTQEYMENL